jgi:sugar phosphate isomerase/epimerase
VSAVAKMGYQVVEFYAPYFQWTPQTAGDVRKLMDDLGIACHSTHNDNSYFSADNLQKAIDLNHAIGAKYLIMASAGRVEGADGWKGVADKLTAAQARLEPLGMGTGYHNHGAEWHEVDGKRPMDIIAAGTPKSVTLQFDIGTAVEAGVDPEAWINANPGRIRSIHCKDWKAGGVGYGAIFGEGDAPWTKIFKAAESTGGVEYYLIEQEAGASDQQLARAAQCLANWKKLRA